MRDYGCGARMADGLPCTTIGNYPMLCDECLRRFVQLLNDCNLTTATPDPASPDGNAGETQEAANNGEGSAQNTPGG